MSLTLIIVSALVPVILEAPESSGRSATVMSAPEARSTRLRQGYLRVDGVARDDLVDALVLRVPHLAFEPFEAASTAELGQGIAFIDLRALPGTGPDGGGTFELTIVVSDGRAFDRTISVGAEDPDVVRLLASTVANLVLAIEAGSVVADRGNVPLPTPVARAEPRGSVEYPAVPVCPACPERPSAPPVAEPPAPAIALGPTVSMLMLTGLGQPEAVDRFVGVGGSVGIRARLPRGALLDVALRTTGRGEPAGARIVRQRFALGGGYELRRAGWSLEGSLWVTIEPWWLLGGSIEPSPRPLWGWVARLAPSYSRDGLARGHLGFSVGPVLELGASAMLGPTGPSIALVEVSQGDDVRSRLRVGGLELSTGLGAAIWFGVPSS